MGVNYAEHLQNPELIALCENCREAKCYGLCHAYKQKFREIDGKPPIIERPGKRKTTRNGEWYREFEAFGERKTLAEWAREKGLSYNTLYMRVHRSGMDIEAALTMTVEEGKKKWLQAD